MGKLKSLKTLKKIISYLKEKGEKIVFTNGCFDLIHPGHIKLFQIAKKKGNVLVVGVNSDSSIRKIKGKRRPILEEKARVAILSSIESIDYIILFNEPDPYKVISELKPHYLVKGSDWEKKDIVGRELVEKVFRVNLVEGYSTSSIIKKICEKYKDEVCE